jgi:hypothetical protein
MINHEEVTELLDNLDSYTATDVMYSFTGAVVTSFAFEYALGKQGYMSDVELYTDECEVKEINNEPADGYTVIPTEQFDQLILYINRLMAKTPSAPLERIDNEMDKMADAIASMQLRLEHMTELFDQLKATTTR